jgi:HNH endonuclease
MEYLISRPQVSDNSKELAANLYFNLWKNKNWPFHELQIGNVLYWYEARSRSIVWKSRIIEVAQFFYQDKDHLRERLRSRFGSFKEDHSYLIKAPASGHCLAYKIQPLAKLNIPKPKTLRFPQLGWLKASDPLIGQWLSAFGHKESQSPTTTPSAKDDLRDEIDTSIDQEDALEDAIKGRTDIGATTKTQLIKARCGQGIFRTNVRFNEKCCRVTGITSIKHLRASHIKPWKDSSDEEKLNGCNGLLLAPHVDHLFDKGFISFENSGEMLVSDQLDSDVLNKWCISAKLNVGSFNKEQIKFLEYHRAHKLKRK